MAAGAIGTQRHFEFVLLRSKPPTSVWSETGYSDELASAAIDCRNERRIRSYLWRPAVAVIAGNRRRDASGDEPLGEDHADPGDGSWRRGCFSVGRCRAPGRQRRRVDILRFVQDYGHGDRTLFDAKPRRDRFKRHFVLAHPCR